MSVEGATDVEAFEAYVEHFLAPTLEEGHVVVLDGLGAHRTDKVRELIESAGADLVFLPSYSPDLNPIEEAFKDKGPRAQGGSTRARGASRGDRASVGGRHGRRRGRLVRPCWLSASGSTLMSTAVSAQALPSKA
jgi:DDE superfamily endonuclease